MAEKLVDIKKIKETMQTERKERSNKCAEAVDKVLKEYRCTFEVSVLITQNGNFPQLQIVSQD
jgi:hypothetical protein